MPTGHVGPHDDQVWSERETWSRDLVEKSQLEALRGQLAYVGGASPFYRRRFDESGFEPGDLTSVEDLRQLPVTTKSDYVESLDAAPPVGETLAAALEDVRRVHFSSGTTSRPTPLFWTQPDLDHWADLYARAAYSQGVRARDVFQCLFSFSWFVGGLGAMAGYERLGCLSIPGGSSDTRRQLETMERLGTTVVAATPSFLLHLAESSHELGFDLRANDVRVLVAGGEPGGQVPGVRERLEEYWGATAFDGYGSIEFQPTAWECAAQDGGHLNEDFSLAEILDPETQEPVPDGEPGVLVLTHLRKQAAPLVRWWTNDMVVRSTATCACGRTSARLVGGVQGRADDMLVIRGVNVFPSAIEDVIRRTPGTGQEHRIVLDRSLVDPATGFLTGIRVQVEGEEPALADRLAARIRQELTVRAEVEVVAPGLLERSTTKSKRVVKDL